MRKLYVFLFCVGFLSGCVTPSLPPGSAPLDADHPLVKDIAPLVQKNCWEAAHPQFLARLTWNKKTVLVEGVWKEGFQRLEGRVLSPLGDTLEEFQITEEKNRLNAKAPLWERMGPQNIRFLFCGGIGLIPQKSGGPVSYFLLPDQEALFSFQNLTWNNYYFYNKSNINTVQKTPTELNIHTSSTITYHSKPIAWLTFQGMMQIKTMLPNIVSIQEAATTYQFHFLDFQ